MFNRNPKYDWEVIISHQSVSNKKNLVFLVSREGSINSIRTNSSKFTVTLDISRKSTKEMEEIKSNILELGYQIDSCTNKGLTTTSWWDVLLDNFLSKEVEQEHTGRLIKKNYYK